MERFSINKKTIAWGVFLVIVASVLFFYFTLNKKSLSVLLNVDMFSIVKLFSLWMLYIFFDAFKFYLISHVGERSIDVKTAFETIVIGIFLAAITPFQVSGFPVQIYYLYKKGIRVGEAVSYLLLRGFITFLGILILALPYSYMLKDSFKGIMKGVYLYAIFVVSLVFLVYLLAIFAPRILRKFMKSKSYNDVTLLRKVLIDALIKKHKRKYLFYALFSTLISLLFLGVIPFVVQKVVGFDRFSLFESIGYQMIIISALLFSPMPGGSGVAETAGSFIFLKSMSEMYVLPFVVLWRFFTFYLSALFGALVFLKQGKELLR